MSTCKGQRTNLRAHALTNRFVRITFISIQGRIVPVAALVCNFPKSLPDRPSLLRHSDVETFFRKRETSEETRTLDKALTRQRGNEAHNQSGR